MLSATARRALRPLLLGLPLFASCNDGSDVGEFAPPPTRMVVHPSAFLGSFACGDAPGSFQRYQATLVDVTIGIENGFVLPSSAVVPCESAVTFEYVEPGHRYIAHVVGFDRDGLSTQFPGSTVVVDEDGHSVSPRWMTTCWGYDDLNYSDAFAGGGGMGGVPINDGFGGFGASFAGEYLGAIAYANTAVTLRGCSPLNGDLDPGLTGISVDIKDALVGLSCGDEPGEISEFTATLVGVSAPEPSAPPDSAAAPLGVGGLGGFGGAGGASSPGGAPGTGGDSGSGGSPALSASALCGDAAVLTGLTPGRQFTLLVSGFESGETAPSFATTCRAFTMNGVITPASCDPLQPIP